MLNDTRTVADFASAVLAVVTIAIAVLNWMLAKATRDTVKEVQRSRELEEQPMPVVTAVERNAHGVEVVDFRNVGRGAAINVVYCALHQNDGTWSRTGVFSLYPNGETPKETHLQQGSPPTGVFDSALPLAENGQRSEVVICGDLVGRRFRIVYPELTPAIWDPRGPSSPFTPADPPKWAEWFNNELLSTPGVRAEPYRSQKTAAARSRESV